LPYFRTRCPSVLGSRKPVFYFPSAPLHLRGVFGILLPAGVFFLNDGLSPRSSRSCEHVSAFASVAAGLVKLPFFPANGTPRADPCFPKFMIFSFALVVLNLDIDGLGLQCPFSPSSLVTFGLCGLGDVLCARLRVSFQPTAPPFCSLFSATCVGVLPSFGETGGSFI